MNQTRPSMGASQLYIQYKISIADILVVMRDELAYGRDIDLSCIMMEMLNNVFFDRVGRYGKYSGVVGIYRQLIPQVITEEQALQVDIQMHDYMGLLADVLSSTFPSMVMRPTNHYFFYPPGETDLVVYVPVTEDLPPEISSKAIPEEAIRSAIR